MRTMFIWDVLQTLSLLVRRDVESSAYVDVRVKTTTDVVVITELDNVFCIYFSHNQSALNLIVDSGGFLAGRDN